MGKQGLFIIWKKNCVHHTWLCLLPMFLIACSGSLGEIQFENVNTVITQSEAAIEQARLANAQHLASDSLQQAENDLASAKEAVQVKDGLEAMHLAYNALTQAQIAAQEAMYKSQGTGLNAIIKRKEADIITLQANLTTADGALEKSRTDVEKLDTQKDQLQADMGRKLQEAKQAHEETLHNYNEIKTEHADLQIKLDTTQTQLLKAQSRAKESERQIYQLRRELADAQSSVEEARKEAAEAQTKAVAQAQNYPKNVGQLNQPNALTRREDTLAEKKRAAKAYVQQQRRNQPARTNTTSLTSKQIASGRTVINDWALAWTAKDIPQHLSRYTQDATLDQTVIRSSNEEQTDHNRTEMVNALKEMVNAKWQETDSEFDADGESVIATYRFSRLLQDAASGEVPVRHDLWTREVWARQVGTEWKIYRESWRIYKAVPRYSTAFN